MKKLILIVLFTWAAQSLFAQIKYNGGSSNDPDSQPRLVVLSMTQPVNTSSQECFTMTFKYKCPTGNCNLQVTKPGSTQNSSSSGAPNTYWKTKSGTVCFNRQSGTYNSSVDCKVQSLKDGCVVVVEGGG